MKIQKWYSTDQVIEIMKQMQTEDPQSYINAVTNAVISGLEKQRPKQINLLRRLFNPNY